MIGDPAYLLPSVRDSKPGIDYQAVIDAEAADVAPFAHGMTMLFTMPEGDGPLGVYGEYEDGVLRKVSVILDPIDIGADDGEWPLPWRRPSPRASRRPGRPRASQAAPSATRLPECRGARLGYGWGSPLLTRANPSRRGPAEMLSLRPSARSASSDRVRGERPPSTVAMITGHASRVDSNLARILFEGISLSEYPIAPSMQISVFSPGTLAYRPTWASLQSNPLTSGMKNSSSGSSFVRMSFALRGAPCGDDSRLRAALGHYHDEERTSAGVPHEHEPIVVAIMTHVRPDSSVWIEIDRRRVVERHLVLRQVDTRLLQIPVVPRHRRTVATGPYPRLTD